MNFALEASKLANFIDQLDDSFKTLAKQPTDSYYHIGALYTNTILQAGVNYKAVVEPRVHRLLRKYPHADTVSSFKMVLATDGYENVIRWSHKEKIERMQILISFSESRNIDTCLDLRNYLEHPFNHRELLNLKGFGPKTLDYLLKLLDFDTVAVDRHIYSFVELAGIETRQDYYLTKRIVEYAADMMAISRSEIDFSIWTYMSTKAYSEKESEHQIRLNF